MKPSATILPGLFSALFIAAAQQTELDVPTYAGVTIKGELGQVYAIEYAT